MEIMVTQDTLKKIVSIGNLENLSKDKAKAFEYQGKKYVYVGGCGNGTGYGWESVWCHEAVAKEDYTGTVTPLCYWDHVEAINLGKRERGYEGRLVSIDGVWHVLTEAVNFVEKI